MIEKLSSKNLSGFNPEAAILREKAIKIDGLKNGILAVFCIIFIFFILMAFYEGTGMGILYALGSAFMGYFIYVLLGAKADYYRVIANMSDDLKK